MTNTAPATNPWASTDHDPISITETPSPTAPPSAPATPWPWPDDIHSAVNTDDEHRRLQYALAARDNAAEVLTDPHATRAEIDYASYYFADAEALIAQLADPDA